MRGACVEWQAAGAGVEQFPAGLSLGLRLCGRGDACGCRDSQRASQKQCPEVVFSAAGTSAVLYLCIDMDEPGTAVWQGRPQAADHVHDGASALCGREHHGIPADGDRVGSDRDGTF